MEIKIETTALQWGVNKYWGYKKVYTALDSKCSRVGGSTTEAVYGLGCLLACVDKDKKSSWVPITDRSMVPASLS